MPKTTEDPATMSGTTFTAQLTRIYEITGCRTQAELGALLEIRQSSISDASRRRSIPATWLMNLNKKGINPEWIITGEGEKLTPSGAWKEQGPGEAEYFMQPSAASILRSILGCLPEQALEDELSRRKRY